LPRSPRIRLAARNAIDEAGGYVAGYRGPYVQVAIPHPAGPFFLAMEGAGLELDEHSLHFFPLGTDQPAEHLRHQRGAPDSPASVFAHSLLPAFR
jgi:hypothetical protein